MYVHGRHTRLLMWLMQNEFNYTFEKYFYLNCRCWRLRQRKVWCRNRKCTAHTNVFNVHSVLTVCSEKNTYLALVLTDCTCLDFYKCSLTSQGLEISDTWQWLLVFNSRQSTLTTRKFPAVCKMCFSAPLCCVLVRSKFNCIMNWMHSIKQQQHKHSSQGMESCGICIQYAYDSDRW